MPISYTDITYIENGQAINAANLNAPSVGLEARSDEIKRDSDQFRFSSDHTTDSDVVLVSDDPASSSILVHTRLKEDGSDDSNLIKYYLPQLNNLHFSIYSKAVHGGRYIIPGSAVGSVFSNATNGTNPVLSSALSVPGDGIFAKIPLRHTGAAEPLNNYPDLVYPKTKGQSIGTDYLATGLTAELVKLPNLTLLDFESNTAGETQVTFMDRVQLQFSDIESYIIDVDNNGTLTIVDNLGANLTLRIKGTQEGAECEVTHLQAREDGQAGFIAKLARSTAPIYIEHLNRIPTLNLEVSLYRGGVLLGESSVPITAGNYSGYFVMPELLDPNFSYVPLIRLTENSLLIANKTIPLAKRILTNGTSINVHEDPVYGVPPEWTAEEQAEYKVDILGNENIDKQYTGVHTVVAGIAEPVTSGQYTYVQLDHSLSPTLVLLKNNLQVGDKIKILSVRATVLEQCVSTTGNTNTVGCTVRLRLGSGLAYMGQGNPVVTVPSNSFDVSNQLELTPTGDNSYTYTAQDFASNDDIKFMFYIMETTAGQNMASGKVYVEFDLAVL